MTAPPSDDTLDRPLAFLDTSAWNLLPTIAGREILRWLLPQYRLAYSNTVIHELLRDDDAVKRADIFEVMNAAKAVCLSIPFDAPYPKVARWDVLDPNLIEATADPAPAMTALLQKFHGAQQNQTLRDAHEAFAEEARQAGALLQSLGRTLPQGFEASLSDSSQHLPKNADDLGTNGRTEFQAFYDIDLSQISPQALHPPNVLSQLWGYLKPRFEAKGCFPASMEDFFVPPMSVHSAVNDPCGVYDRCTPMYTMLNFVGFCADKSLTKDHRVIGAVRDASHVAWGSLCGAFVVADERCYRKAFAIYEHYRRSRTVFLNLNGRNLTISPDWH